MLIKVKCFPESKKEEIIQKSSDSFDIKIREKAEQGKANEKVKEMLIDFFKTKRIRLIKGSKERSKIYKIDE
jgi:uncharacterized protein (TIGR00251 family)